MHTFKTPSGNHINYNSDLSGDLRITKPDGSEIWIPAADILAFIKSRLTDKMISLAEQQQPMPPEFAEILNDNFWEMYKPIDEK